MQIASAASAFPKNYYPQKFLLEQLQQYWGEKLKNPQMLARLHRNVSVEGRHLALPYEQYYNLHTWGDANDVWIQVARELGEQALCRALHHAVEFDVEAGVSGDVRESSIAVIVIKTKCGAGFLVSGPVGAIDQQNVLPAISIVVEKSTTRAKRLGQKLSSKRAAVVLKMNSRLRGHVCELEAQRVRVRLGAERLQP